MLRRSAQHRAAGSATAPAARVRRLHPLARRPRSRREAPGGRGGTQPSVERRDCPHGIVPATAEVAIDEALDTHACPAGTPRRSRGSMLRPRDRSTALAVSPYFAGWTTRGRQAGRPRGTPHRRGGAQWAWSGRSWSWPSRSSRPAARGRASRWWSAHRRLRTRRSTPPGRCWTGRPTACCTWPTRPGPCACSTSTAVVWSARCRCVQRWATIRSC